MPDIYSDFPINVPAADVFRVVSTPAGLDQWWTKRSAGTPQVGAEYELSFGPEYDWRARVTACAAPRQFEIEITRAGEDWLGTRVGFDITGQGATSLVRFWHTGWPQSNEHYRVSCYCWPMYLRILRRYLEHGETVPYEQRLEV
jgi:uncharacterized protein YndB with AHSA1/START domain